MSAPLDGHHDTLWTNRTIVRKSFQQIDQYDQRRYLYDLFVATSRSLFLIDAFLDMPSRQPFRQAFPVSLFPMARI